MNIDLLKYTNTVIHHLYHILGSVLILFVKHA